MSVEQISVVGLGKLGAPLAACFAWKGFLTMGLDRDPCKVQAISHGVAPIYEPGLQELLHNSEKRLTGTENYEKAVMNSDVTFIVVPTPTDAEGKFTLRYVLEAGEQIGDALRKKPGYHLVVLTSTVIPGATEGELKPLLEVHSGKRCGQDFGLCYSPEFIALGSVIRDFLNPDFILIGESDPHSGEMLAALYRRVCDNDPPVARMNFVSAELTKLAVNTYVTMKISFANMLARLCERLPGADVDVVTPALGLDSRIGRKYLKGALGYGGPCFPRDNIALATLARSVGAPAALAEATDTFNRQQVEWLADLVKSCLPEQGRVGILGLAYKPNSDVVEESQGVLLAQALAHDGVAVVAYDPVATENAQRALNGLVTLTASMDECIRQVDVVVVTTPWEEFKQLTPVRLARHSPPRILIDCWRILGESQFGDGVEYLPLGIQCSALQRWSVRALGSSIFS
jgi:UDPglucose 6-dehydrogenase